MHSLVEQGLHLPEGHERRLLAQGGALVAHHLGHGQAHAGPEGRKQLALRARGCRGGGLDEHGCGRGDAREQLALSTAKVGMAPRFYE